LSIIPSFAFDTPPSLSNILYQFAFNIPLLEKPFLLLPPGRFTLHTIRLRSIL
jgi:hypothetical protein